MSEKLNYALENSKIVLRDTVLDNATIAVRNGRISAVGQNIDTDGLEVEDVSGKIIIAGAIDIHVHGAMGFDTVCGVYDSASDTFIRDEETYKNGMKEFLAFHKNRGTTTLLPTTAAESVDVMKTVFSWMADVIESPNENAPHIEGIYVEGTYLKDPDCCGAMNPKFFLEPTIKSFTELDNSARGLLRIINIVPEYGETSLELIKHITGLNRVAAIGHTSSDADMYRACVDAGATLHVHLSNGPAFTTFKPNGGAHEVAITDDRVVGELIVDGYHIDPAYVMSFLEAKNFNCVCITDCMFAAGAGSFEEFTFAGKRGAVADEGKILRVAGTRNTLFGGVLNVAQGIRNLVEWFESGVIPMYHHSPIVPDITRDKALVIASKLFSAQSAKVLGIENEVGTLEVGKRADLVILNDNLEVEDVRLGAK